MSHRCAELEETEAFHRLPAVPASPLAISLTQFIANAWVLQLCRASADLMVVVSFCPFCGVRLGDAA